MTQEKEIHISTILSRVPNRFLLSLAISRRARQLKEGARPLIQVENIDNVHPILTALEEIQAGKLNVIVEENKDEDLEMIEEIDRYFDDKDPDDPDSSPTDKTPKKEPTKKSKSKSLAA